MGNHRVDGPGRREPPPPDGGMSMLSGGVMDFGSNGVHSCPCNTPGAIDNVTGGYGTGQSPLNPPFLPPPGGARIGPVDPQYGYTFYGPSTYLPYFIAPEPPPQRPNTGIRPL